MKELFIEIMEHDQLEDNFKGGQMLDIEYEGDPQGTKRRVEFIKPILLAKAGAGMMVIQDGQHKSFALDKCTRVEKVLDECLLSDDNEPDDGDAPQSESDDEVDSLKDEIADLKDENEDLKEQISLLQSQMERITEVVGSALQ